MRFGKVQFQEGGGGEGKKRVIAQFRRKKEEFRHRRCIFELLEKGKKGFAHTSLHFPDVFLFSFFAKEARINTRLISSASSGA